MGLADKINLLSSIFHKIRDTSMDLIELYSVSRMLRRGLKDAPHDFDREMLILGLPSKVTKGNKPDEALGSV